MIKKFLQACALGCLLAGSALGQDLQFENVHFPGSLGFSRNTDNGLGMLYRLRGLEENHSRFLYTTFDSSGQAHQANILLYRRNNALASSGNANFSAHLFQRVGYDSLKVLVLDKNGRQISKREFRTVQGEARLVNLSRTANDSLFTFFYKARGRKGNFLVKKVDLQQQIIWEQELTPAAGTVSAEFFNEKDHVWMVCRSKPASRTMAYTIVCLDNASGRILSSTILHQEKDRREIADITIGPDKEMVIIGRHFNKKRLSRNKPGNFFFTRISPSGERLSDFVYSQDQNPNALTAMRKTRILWENLHWNPQGHWELVGESFHSTSFMTDFGMRVGTAMLTLGTVQVGYAKLKTKDLIHVQISPEGQVKKLQVYNLPPTRLVLGSWQPAYEFAKIAKAAGTFRFRGAFEEPYSIVVKTRDDIRLIETAQAKTTSLADIDRKEGEDILGVSGRQLLLYSTSPSYRSVHIRRMPLPGHLFPQVKAESTGN
ncbi:MAG: hypothetical protein ACO1NZ_12210 [Adhaeribacter sp.]